MKNSNQRPRFSSMQSNAFKEINGVLLPAHVLSGHFAAKQVALHELPGQFEMHGPELIFCGTTHGFAKSQIVNGQGKSSDTRRVSFEKHGVPITPNDDII